MFKLFNVNKQTVRVFFLAWRSLKQTSWTLEEPGTRRFRKLACASPEGPTPVLGTRDSRRRLPSPTGGTCSSVTSGLTPCLRANEKGFEHEAVTAKPPVSPDLSLSLGPQGGARPRTHLWKTAEQSRHTEVWLSKGNSTSPSLQSSHTKPLAWHRWGWGWRPGCQRCSQEHAAPPHPGGWARRRRAHRGAPTSQSSLMCLAKSVWVSVSEQPRRPVCASSRSWTEYISSFSTKCCRSWSCGSSSRDSKSQGGPLPQPPHPCPPTVQALGAYGGKRLSPSSHTGSRHDPPLPGTWHVLLHLPPTFLSPSLPHPVHRPHPPVSSWSFLPSPPEGQP